MPPPETQALGREWTALHDSHEQYEKHCLQIKLGAVLLCAVAAGAWLPAIPAMALLLLLWGQESICRTGQARIAERILRIEALLAGGGAGDRAAFRLYGEWQAGRPGTVGLLGEYARNALRPTVAFPHALLIVVLLAVPLR